MNPQTLLDLETELIRRNAVDADLLRQYYTAIQHEIGEPAAQAFARTVLNIPNLTFATFLCELQVLAANDWIFPIFRFHRPPMHDDVSQSDGIKARFFSNSQHQVGIPQIELRTLPLMTA